MPINRRQLFARAAAIAAAMGFAPVSFHVHGCSGDDAAPIEAWMDQWMSTTRLPVGALYVSRFKEPVYFLVKPIAWIPSGEGVGDSERVEVPVGFVTDFASIPRVFWSLLRPDGEYAYAAVVHDYLYWAQTRSREASDKVFMLVMADFGIDAATRRLIFGAVRAAGGVAWRQNAEWKERGEKRILKLFPEDPRTSWLEWKKRPEVFE